ncbi:DsbA family protein [Streptacidiphilus monticola]|uniref:DsbA family protein n=1 Tax=Streptacidiphilus monticola TaxID=2161674 RepID=A0ABW1G382_9ACTN
MSPAQENGRPNPWPRRLGWLVVAAAVFAVAGGVGALVRHNNANKLQIPVGAVGPRGLALPANGSPGVTLTLFEDMRSPETRAFQHTYGAALNRLVDAGLVKIQYREIAGVDRAQGGTGSLHAANALACAQNAKDFLSYRRVLLAHQPAASDDAFGSNAYLIKLAKRVHGLDTDVFRACVDKGDYRVWARTSTDAFVQQYPNQSTPVLELTKGSLDETLVPGQGGQAITPDALVDRVVAVALGRPSASATPSPSPSKAAAKSKKKHKAGADPTATAGASASATP